MASIGPASDVAGTIKVFLVESDARVRRGVRSVIESFPDLEVAGEAPSHHLALGGIADTTIDVVIVELELPTASDGLELVRALGRKGCSVVAMSIRGLMRPAAIKAGAFCFVEKDENGAVGLVEAVRAAATQRALRPDL